jgi:coenzyme F420-reducing hydrogenase gamma subunit
LLDCEDELLKIAESIEIAYFLEARSQQLPGPYDIGLVEGSITTPHDRDRIQEIRRSCRSLITIGACATSGGIQALRNWADHGEFLSYVYARPQFIQSLATSTAISDHVRVDYELRGCPIDKHQLLQVVTAFARGLRPRLPTYSVCVDCKRQGTVCVAVTRGIPCLGPVTQAGCGGAICPSHHRECFGCFGPQELPNTKSLCEHYRSQRVEVPQLVRLMRNFNCNTPVFREAGNQLSNDATD